MSFSFPSIPKLWLLTAIIATQFSPSLAVPSMENYKVIWSDDFNGAAGSQVNQNLWNYETPSSPSNSEQEKYTDSASNGGLSGSGTLRITPLKSSSGAWTSARLASWESFTCEAEHKMVIQASIKVGNNPASAQQGIWPAFWAMGESKNTAGVPWPQNGEWDIMELVNGATTNVATIHWAANNQLRQGFVGFDRSQWHTWAIKVDRQPSTWERQTIRWYLDGNNYFTVSGADIGDYDSWVILARSPFYILLNVAVGGTYPGPTNANTQDGLGSGMEVDYVAVYAGTVAAIT